MIENSLKKMATFKASFEKYDNNGDGTISPTELRAAMAHLGHALSEANNAALFNRIDVDGDGSISRDEFMTLAESFQVDVPEEGTAAAIENL